MSGTPENPTVLDTTVLSNFAQVSNVELLCDLPRVATVDAVRTELEDGVETHPYLDDAVDVLEDGIPVLTPSSSAETVETELLKTLDPGEAQVLAVAETADGTAVTDDGDARTTAKRRGVAVTGSIGLLVRFVENDRLDHETADTYLKRWIDEAGFRAPSRDIEVFLSE
ncbi:twitching motility protein PilT [Haloarchaeobius litoreus]|uniref:Twitching motility protein PilT n=1 Tax=Haloarchaeobius litoreus TaxID=755306 RepID=A0ABD6DDG2_9EURY|nr:twitching motility protein PilT [Haloarchaeobius litoreus]